jgi:hypothetical protein
MPSRSRYAGEIDDVAGVLAALGDQLGREQ